MVDVKELAEDPFLTPSQIAKMFGVTPYTVRQWIKNGDLSAEKLHGRLKVRRSNVQAYAQKEFGSDDTEG